MFAAACLGTALACASMLGVLFALGRGPRASEKRAVALGADAMRILADDAPPRDDRTR
jgi:hypothetical protein